MKRIGLLAGMSWESSAVYYRIMNEAVKERLGGLHSAQILMHSFDFEEIAALQRANRWDLAAERLIEAAQGLERSGADLMIIGTNTMHKLAAEIAAAIQIPLIHIADPTGEAIRAQGITTVGLLGTAYTMEQEFYKQRLVERFGLRVIVPEAEERKLVHDVIFQELCVGQVRPDSRQAYKEIMARLVEQGAEGIILGCTEIQLLVQDGDASVPLFDTTRLHAERAVELALAPALR